MMVSVRKGGDHVLVTKGGGSGFLGCFRTYVVTTGVQFEASCRESGHRYDGCGGVIRKCQHENNAKE